MTKYHQGFYKPKNPAKYAGDPNNIVYRSSWELKFFRFCDLNPNVIFWASEEMAVPYNDKATGKLRRYFPDFLIKIKTKNGEIQTWMIEIKPLAQTMAPVRGNKKDKTYLREVKTFATNISKWEAARRFCELNNMKFQILTEKELGTF